MLSWRERASFLARQLYAPKSDATPRGDVTTRHIILFAFSVLRATNTISASFMTIIILRYNRIGVLILYLDIRDVMSENMIVALSICAIHLWPKKVSRITRFNRLSNKYRNYIVQQLNIAVNDIGARSIQVFSPIKRVATPLDSKSIRPVSIANET